MLHGAEEIEARVRALAREIAERLPADFLMVTVLKGAFVFTADLVRALSKLDAHPEITFITLSSYGKSTESSGRVRMVGALPDEVAGRYVLLVDDILDTGLTLAYAREQLIKRGATGVRLCVLVDKPARRKVALGADFVGFKVGDRFVVGYGIDHAERYRDLPYLGALDEAKPRSGG